MLINPLLKGIIPKLELKSFKNIDFFPSRTEVQIDGQTLCIGTKSRNLGDALALTSLPQRICESNQSARIYTYPRGFNSVVFYNNPYVKGVQFLPDRVFGDDANWGNGQLIQLKEQFFNLAPQNNPRPQIYLTDAEENWGQSYLSALTRPKCILHPFGVTWKKIADLDFWSQIVKTWSKQIDFVQVGLKGDAIIPGTATQFLSQRSVWEARKLFTITRHCQGFIGIDSGPMHVARTFEVPSLILTPFDQVKEKFNNRERYPYFLHSNWKYSTLYQANQHVEYQPDQVKQLFAQVEGHLQAFTRQN